MNNLIHETYKLYCFLLLKNKFTFEDFESLFDRFIERE